MYIYTSMPYPDYLLYAEVIRGRWYHRNLWNIYMCVGSIMEVNNAVCLSNLAVESVATKVVQELGYETLKPEQLQIRNRRVARARRVRCVARWLWENCFACLLSA